MHARRERERPSCPPHPPPGLPEPAVASRDPGGGGGEAGREGVQRSTSQEGARRELGARGGGGVCPRPPAPRHCIRVWDLRGQGTELTRKVIRYGGWQGWPGLVLDEADPPPQPPSVARGQGTMPGCHPGSRQRGGLDSASPEPMPMPESSCGTAAGLGFGRS